MEVRIEEGNQLQTKEDGTKEIHFTVDAVAQYSGQLFWSVPASSFKRCCKDLAKGTSSSVG